MPLPVPKLDDKRYADLVEQARQLIPRHAPAWTDHNAHDPGITLIELFAWLAEAQIYTLDQVTDRHLEKFLRLLGATPQPARPAKVTAVLSLPQGPGTPLKIAQGTRLVGRHGGSDTDVFFETDQDLWLIASRIVKIERITPQGRSDLTEAYVRGPYIYPFGGEAGVPIGVSQLLLALDLPLPAVEVSLTVELYEADLPPVGGHGGESLGITPSAQVAWEYLAEGGLWRPLPDLVDGTRAFSVGGQVRFTGPVDALALTDGGVTGYWLRCRVLYAGYEIAPRIASLSFDRVTATEGQALPLAVIGSAAGLPSQKIALSGGGPVEPYSLVVEVQETTAGPWSAWTRVLDFDASGPEDNHYSLDPERGAVGFGDGLHGRIPPRGPDNIRAAYRVGGGKKGNLAPGEIDRVLDPALAMVTVTNPQAATGGTDAESLSDAWSRVRADLATPYRAVTAADFETLALATPGLRVARAKALTQTGDDCGVTVVVVPYSLGRCPVPSDGFLNTVCRHLERHRLIATGLRVVPPLYVGVSLEVSVSARPKSAPGEVAKRVGDRLKTYLDPLHGGSTHTGWPFGRAVRHSEVTGVIESVEGVACVTRLRVQRASGQRESGGDVTIPEVALICLGHVQVEVTEPSHLQCEVEPCQKPAQ